MGLYLDTGNDLFEISVNDDIYIDKSMLIAYTNKVLGKSSRYICASRPRRFGKSMAAGMLAAYYDKARNDYMLVREFPGGKGFADIVFIPEKNCNKPALVVELKWDQSADGAINQIKNKNYAGSLAGYFGDVLLVGINYDKENKKHGIERFQRIQNK